MASPKYKSSSDVGDLVKEFLAWAAIHPKTVNAIVIGGMLFSLFLLIILVTYILA